MRKPAPGPRCSECNALKPRHVRGCVRKDLEQMKLEIAQVRVELKQLAFALDIPEGCSHSIGTADVCESCRGLVQ